MGGPACTAKYLLEVVFDKGSRPSGSWTHVEQAEVQGWVMRKLSQQVLLTDGNEVHLPRPSHFDALQSVVKMDDMFLLAPIRMEKYLKPRSA